MYREELGETLSSSEEYLKEKREEPRDLTAGRTCKSLFCIHQCPVDQTILIWAFETNLCIEAAIENTKCIYKKIIK